MISPLASISSEVKIGKNVKIAPFVVIEGDVVIGDNTEIFSHATIIGPVTIGTNNKIYQGVSIGTPPQDLSYQGSEYQIIIGNGNVFREGVTIHAPVSYADETISKNTVIGDNCFLMVNSHVAHNTVLGNNVIFANGVLPAGCCIIGDGAFISGNVLIHQGVRIGAYVIISGGSRVGRDIPPFMMVSSFYGLISGVNSIGLRRAGFSSDERKIAKDIFRIFKENNSLNLAKDAILNAYPLGQSRLVDITLAFLEGSKRGLSEFGEGKEAKDSLFF